jgi:predicted transcriptional regulator of viral defense system
MKSKKNLLEQLDNLPHFSNSTINQLAGQFGLKEASVNTYISRFLKRKEILPLKKGLYISAEYYAKNKTDISYSFYLANVLRTPSYISSWTALQYYNLATEAIPWQLFSTTPKVTRRYEVRGVGTFSYQSIQKGLFSDYSLVKGKFDFFIASPSKALFDLLYFRTRQFRGVRFDGIKKMVEELRIDIDEMSEEERNKFYEKIKTYLHE